MRIPLVLMTTLAILFSGCGESKPIKRRKGLPLVKERNHWLHSHDKALAESQNTGKPVLAFFTGSDWCQPCQMLDATILNTPEFSTWAKENVILLELDFPKKKSLSKRLTDQNRRLAATYQIKNFPTVLILATDGTPLLTTGYIRVPAKRWVEVLDKKLKEAIAMSTATPQ